MQKVNFIQMKTYLRSCKHLAAGADVYFVNKWNTFMLLEHLTLLICMQKFSSCKFCSKLL